LAGFSAMRLTMCMRSNSDFEAPADKSGKRIAISAVGAGLGCAAELAHLATPVIFEKSPMRAGSSYGIAYYR